jgi:crotonobetainyl-CoA:carnitine CoA-transferase CaiB-like acyl-CoA transferase
MFDGQVSYLVYLATAWLNGGELPPRMGNRHLSIAPYSTYAAADGWLNIAVANQRLWGRFCTLLQRPDLAANPLFATNALRVENVDALEAAFAPELKRRTVAEWVEALDEVGIPAGPVQTLDQVLTHPQLAARGMISSVVHPVAGEIRMAGIAHRLSATPGVVRMAPPTLGQHTDVILAELGYEPTRIADLRASGVV